MKVFDQTIPALEAIRQNFQGGYTVHSSFVVSEDKLKAKHDQIICDFGTKLSVSQQHDRKRRGMPTARAVCLRVVGQPGKWLIVIQATPLACQAPPLSPFSRENWSNRLPSIGDFVLVHEPAGKRKYTWTFKLSPAAYWQLSRHLHKLVTQRSADRIAFETKRWPRVYPMEGGVRRQLIGLLKSEQKLWKRLSTSSWPGVLPEELPILDGFRGNHSLIDAKNVGASRGTGAA